jgi:putative DNA primase/helicase
LRTFQRPEILNRLEGVRETPNGWDCRCPAHPDRKASLSVAVTANGTILLKCHAGCSTDAVVKALGLSLKNLFPVNGHHAHGKPKLGKIVSTYDYRDETGELVYQVCRFEPKAFRQRKPDGKGGWTWKVGDARRVLYRLPELLTADPTHLVFIVEGEKDADALGKLALLATTNPGGTGKWKPDYNEPLRGRQVAILADNDAPGRAHARDVAKHLSGIAAVVKVVDLPGLPPKGDVSDWLAAGGTVEQLWSLVRQARVLETAQVAESVSGESLGVHEAGDDPHRLGRLYLDDHRIDGLLTFRSWREEYYRWDGSAYRQVPEGETRAEFCERVKQEFDNLGQLALAQWEERGQADEKAKPTPPPVARKVTTRLITDVAQAVASMALLPASVESPSWLEGDGPFSPNEALVCRNGIVHLPSFVDGAPHFHKHTPKLFCANALPYDFDPRAPTPGLWLDFLQQLWPNDAQCIDTLQEWFGYLLTPDTRQQKILMIVGPMRSGKGTIGRVLRGLIGEWNTAGPTLASFGTNFGLSALLGKALAIISDARLSGRTDSALVTERLLSISGEDTLSVDRKFKPILNVKLPTRLVILTNELPRFTDASGALAGRLIFLRMQESFYGREDHTLTDQLLRELPGILLWAIAGWARLRERRRFRQPESSESLLSDMQDIASPVGAFVRECCVMGDANEVFVRDLFDRWKTWCEAKGRREHGTEAVFGRDLRAVLPKVDVRQPRTETGDRVRTYVGIGLKT